VRRFNVSEWALAHRGLVVYFMAAIAILGTLSYTRLGQSEDPPFTFKVMVIRTDWPGATAREVEQKVTERIERKLQELDGLDTVRSYSRPGVSQVFVAIDGRVPSARVPDLFYQVRKKVADIRNTLPEGVRGPFFNDEFGDTFGNVYALTGEGFTYRELKEYADEIRRGLLRVRDVAKVELIGEQDEKIWIELASTKLATLALDIPQLVGILQAQNAIAPAGYFETPTDRIYLRVDGAFDSVEDVAALEVRVQGRTFRLGDIARVWRGYADPPAPKIRFMGREAIGLGVSMKAGGDIVALGRALDAETDRVSALLPAGLELARVNDQPRAVRDSIAEFTRSVAEAVIIVLAVSFFSLGARSGLVVALTIPLVLAATFLSMHLLGVGLHKISLGSLILALGLLVDDAIIVVEMMAVKIEEGYDRARAAAFAYTSTAFPMLTGTLVTAAGFLPIATAQSSTGEYTRSIFQVVSIALLISWVAAVVVVPYLGYRLLPARHAADAPPGRGPLAAMGRLNARLTARFYAGFRRAVDGCVTHRWAVVALTMALFAVSVWGFRFVPQQFFPASTRLELLVDIKLAEGASFEATEREVRRMEALLTRHAEGIENFASYVGTGSPRFYLPLDQQLPTPSFAQFVITTRGIAEREALRAKLIEAFQREEFTDVRGRVLRLENGPPVGFPLQYRVSGEDLGKLRAIAGEVAQVMRGHPEAVNVQFDWDERSKVIRLEIDQAKARALGISSQELATFLNGALVGLSATYYREKDKLVEVLLRSVPQERERMSLLENLSVPTRAGKSVPLAQIARVHYELEEGVIWRRDRLPTITVRADVYGGVQPATVVAALAPRMQALRAALPPGYFIQVGGAVEESAKGGDSIVAGLPLFVLVVLTVLMLQLQSFPRVLLVVLTAPLGLIGVTGALLLFNKPFGFVAMLGTIALSGMIMRNSVILIDQIERDIAHGAERRDAIIDAAVRRFRPIMLTALAAILAMIPLTRSAFFGPMAVAIMGGLFVATVLTLLFLPAAYAASFRVRANETSATAAGGAEAPAPV
jgi:multidrug efflux pump